MAGSKVGETVVKGAQKVREYIRDKTRIIVEKGKEFGGFVINKIKNIFC